MRTRGRKSKPSASQEATNLTGNDESLNDPSPRDDEHLETEQDSNYEPFAFAEIEDVEVELIDPSTWFEDADDGRAELIADQRRSSRAEVRAPEFTPAPVSEIISDETSGPVVEMAEVVDSPPVTAAEPVRAERRKHRRDDSSHLVWVEYFDASMQSVGNEAARTENFGAGGMRVLVKAAPSELERVRVTSSYRGFESHAIVRNRYPGLDGYDRLCLEFVNKEWKANAVSNSVGDDLYPTKLGKILFADDDPAFRKILGKVLVRAGYDVVLAEDGESAVEKAAAEKPDLVITDGLMPKLHGFLVCKAVKELNPPTKVIMLTAVYTNSNYKWEARNKFGADEIITKPCEIADLLRSIERHMPSRSQNEF